MNKIYLKIWKRENSVSLVEVTRQQRLTWFCDSFCKIASQTRRSFINLNMKKQKFGKLLSQLRRFSWFWNNSASIYKKKIIFRMNFNLSFSVNRPLTASSSDCVHSQHLIKKDEMIFSAEFLRSVSIECFHIVSEGLKWMFHLTLSQTCNRLFALLSYLVNTELLQL